MRAESRMDWLFHAPRVRVTPECARAIPRTGDLGGLDSLALTHAVISSRSAY